MGLNGALHVGRSALHVSQLGIQNAGNNMANAATEGYHRRSVHLSPMPDEPLGRGEYVGRGVQLQSIRREVDVALQSRLRDAISQEHAALAGQGFMAAIESLQNELSDNDLSSLLSRFFNSFSELANNPEDGAIRSLVLQEGRTLADRVATLRSDYSTVQHQADDALNQAVIRANELLDQIGAINLQVAQTEAGLGQANALRDQRDGLIDELSTLMDVSVIEQPGGVADVFVGSIPVVLAGSSRGVELRSETIDGELQVSVRVRDDGSNLNVRAGRIGGLLSEREAAINEAIDTLETFATELIFQVNRLHAQGQGRSELTVAEGIYTIADTTTNLNAAATGLPYRMENGSFFIHTTHLGTGVRTAHQINVDGDAMSLDDLIAQINTAVGPGTLTASAGAGNRLRLEAAAGVAISFSDDSSGALAALGVNTFFSGSTASDIDVEASLLENPDRLSAGAGHVAGSNGTALAIAQLQEERLPGLKGSSLREYWQGAVNQLAIKTGAANDAIEATTLVRESIGAQVQSVSGVSLDEEAINLLTFQRQFQAAARFISVIDETMQTLLAMGI